MDITKVSEGIELLALRPGDRLAIRIPDAYIEEEDIAEMRRRLQEAWPEVVPVFFTGDVQLTVIRPEETEALSRGLADLNAGRVFDFKPRSG